MHNKKIIKAILSFTLLSNNFFFVHAEEPDTDSSAKTENIGSLYEEEPNAGDNTDSQESNFTKAPRQIPSSAENIEIEEQDDESNTSEIDNISSELFNEEIDADYIDILSPNIIINIEEGTQQPEGFSTEEIINCKEIMDVINQKLDTIHQRSLGVISMVKINFTPDPEINLIENKVFNNETGEYEVFSRSGSVYFTESNIEYNLSRISFLKTMWVSENLSEVKRLNHSVIDNDIHFSTSLPGYIVVLEAQWVSDSVEENKGLAFINPQTDLRIKRENAMAGILYAVNASPTSENNLNVTINWVNDTEGTRASSATIHVIRGVLTVNGVGPDANGNVDVACVYGSTPETSNNCYTVETDVPANVDWEALDAQKEQIDELKQKLGITD